MDELHGILTAYKMKKNTKNEQPRTREIAFKASKNIRNKGHNEEERSYNEWDENKEENFVRKLKRGTEKYKGKLPFKCFNFGRIGHQANKFPFEEHKGFYRKKSLYSKEENNSLGERDGEEREPRIMNINFLK